MQDKLKPDTDFSDPDRPAIYVHVPFCSRPCAYCRFYKTRPTAADIEAYLGAIEKEAEYFFERHDGVKPLSVFFGGGTPTSFNEKQLERLCGIFSRFAEIGEWTIEASPSTVNAGKLKALTGMGVNRLSLGVQSFDERTLGELGRAHSAANALKAIDAGLEVFENMNIDLIFGSSGQTEEMWRKDLERAVSYPFKHISAYCLEFESATSCCAGIEKPMADQEREVDFLNIAIESLGKSGFGQYEISNYAKSGWECVQNINTWRMGSWIGFGPSAASQFGGHRFQNPQNLEEWLKGVESGNARHENIVTLDDDELYSSALIFGLRMRSGVDLYHLKKRFPLADFPRRDKIIEELVAQNLLERRGQIVFIPKEKITYADSVGEELL